MTRRCYDEMPALMPDWMLPVIESPRELEIVARTALRMAELYMRATASDPDYVKLPRTPTEAREWQKPLREAADALLERVRHEDLDADAALDLQLTASYKIGLAGLYEGIARLLEVLEALEKGKEEWAPPEDLPAEAEPQTHTLCYRAQRALQILAGGMTRMCG